MRKETQDTKSPEVVKINLGTEKTVIDISKPMKDPESPWDPTKKILNQLLTIETRPKHLAVQQEIVALIDELYFDDKVLLRNRLQEFVGEPGSFPQGISRIFKK